MALRMTQPVRHSKSGTYRLRLTIPTELRDTALRLYGVRQEFITNLATKDRREAIRLAPDALATLQTKLDNVRASHTGQGRRLTTREVQALAGGWYRAKVLRHEDDPGPREGWDAFGWHTIDEAGQGPDGTHDYEPSADALTEAERLLAGHNITADAASARALAVALWSTKVDLAGLLSRRAGGDYSPDPVAATFPTMPPPALRIAALPLADLVRAWGVDNGYNPEALPVPRALYDRQRTTARLAAFLGHKDAARVTKGDAVRWKESMTGKKASTIGNDISEMSAVWKWAVKHGKLADNVFAGLLPPRKAIAKKAKKIPYSDEQLVQVLTAARVERGFLRYGPWVLALTGARLSEVAQAMKDDVIEIGGRLFLRIHADDEDGRAPGEAQRSVKNAASVRTIPLHPRLIAEGFAGYVQALPPGSPLWPDVAPDKQYGNRGVTAQRRLSKWVRETVGIADVRISPAHSFRHWFVDACRRAGISETIRDALTGHSDTRNESANYGYGLKGMPDILAAAMDTITLPGGL